MLTKLLFSLVAGFAVFNGALLSIAHLQTGATCPMIGPLPACYLVLTGYTLVLVSVWLKRTWRARLFWLGWSPVALLAGLGTGLQLTRGETCPRTAGGIPQCFISLAMVVALLVLWLLIRHRTTAMTETR